MARKLYLDTNIYLDYWKDRRDNIKPIGEFAFQILKRAIECEFVIVYSIFVVNELCLTLSIDREECYRQFFEDLDTKKKVEYAAPSHQIKDAVEMLKERYALTQNDAMHLAIAQSYGATLVTRDKHYQDLRDTYAIKLPEEL